MLSLRKKAVIFDLDDTLTNLDHRRYLIEKTPKNYPKFYSLIPLDKPRRPAYDKLRRLAEVYDILIITSRPATAQIRKDTADWLRKYGVPYNRILFRPLNLQYLPAPQLKQRLVQPLKYEYDIKAAYDDEPEVRRMYQQLGISAYEI